MGFSIEIMEAVGKAVRINSEYVEQNGEFPKSIDSPFLPAWEAMDLIFNRCLCANLVERNSKGRLIVNRFGQEILRDFDNDYAWAGFLEKEAELMALRKFQSESEIDGPGELEGLIEILRELGDARPKYRPILKRAALQLEELQRLA